MFQQHKKAFNSWQDQRKHKTEILDFFSWEIWEEEEECVLQKISFFYVSLQVIIHWEKELSFWRLNLITASKDVSDDVISRCPNYLINKCPDDYINESLDQIVSGCPDDIMS